MTNLRDLGWFFLRYGVLIVGFVAFLVGVFFIFQGLIQQREIIEKESRISVWFLAQTEIEFLRFTEALKAYELAPGPDTARTANERFEVFWSRSEEHTSELQSLMSFSYDDFCLNKKKTTKTIHEAKR